MAGIIPLVLDFGTGVSKAGFAGHDVPKLIYQTCVQQQEMQESSYTRGQHPPVVVGNDDLANGHLIFPIEHGIVTDWDNIESIWSYAFKELNVSLEDRPLLIAEAPLNPKRNREIIAQIMFEKYETPALYFANTAMMCAHNLDKTTCLVVEMGEGVISAVPFNRGQALLDCAQRYDFGGKELTKYLKKLLDDSERNGWGGFTCEERFTKKSGITEVVRKAKEQFCKVAPHSLGINRYREPKLKVIPYVKGGKQQASLMIGAEDLFCAEGLFDPSRLGLSAKGIHEFIVNTIDKCDESIQTTLYGNIELFGGTARFTNIAKRLKNEIIHLVYEDVRVGITVAAEVNAVWAGATKVAPSPIFRQLCTNKEKYEEIGNEYLHCMAAHKMSLDSSTFKLVH